MDTDKLEREYREEIESWDIWKDKPDFFLDSIEYTENGEFKASHYIGSILNIFPSGKYYTPWSNSHIEEREAIEDEIFGEVLNDIASQYNCWIESGEGDALDLFLCKSVSFQDIDSIPFSIRCQETQDIENLFYSELTQDIENLYSEYPSLRESSITGMMEIIEDGERVLLLLTDSNRPYDIYTSYYSLYFFLGE